MRVSSSIYAAGIALAAIVASGCENLGDSPTVPSATGPETGEPSRQWTMPDLVGGNLQEAQNQIQSLTGNPLFLTTSHDATGQNRNQVVDSNWKVCTQNVAAGSPFTQDTVIDFGAVQTAETCP